MSGYVCDYFIKTLDPVAADVVMNFANYAGNSAVKRKTKYFNCGRKLQTDEFYILAGLKKIIRAEMSEGFDLHSGLQFGIGVPVQEYAAAAMGESLKSDMDARAIYRFLKGKFDEQERRGRKFRRPKILQRMRS